MLEITLQTDNVRYTGLTISACSIVQSEFFSQKMTKNFYNASLSGNHQFKGLCVCGGGGGGGGEIKMDKIHSEERCLCSHPSFGFY